MISTPIGSTAWGGTVEAVVDLEREVMAVGEGIHADEETGLLDEVLIRLTFRINLYPAEQVVS